MVPDWLSNGLTGLVLFGLVLGLAKLLSDLWGEDPWWEDDDPRGTP